MRGAFNEQESEMASISKRRSVDGDLTWDACVRVRGYPSRTKSFRTRLDAEAWSSRTEAAAHGRTLTLGQWTDRAQMERTSSCD